MSTTIPAHSNKFIVMVEKVLFNVRWGLILFYLGLIAALILYTYTYCRSIYELFNTVNKLTGDQMVMAILELMDITMVANLTETIITGSYNSFVSKKHGYKNKNISSGALKIKMSTSIIMIMGIHVLQDALNDSLQNDIMHKHLLIFGISMLGALTLTIIEMIHVKTEKIEFQIHKDEQEEEHEEAKALAEATPSTPNTPEPIPHHHYHK